MSKINDFCLILQDESLLGIKKDPKVLVPESDSEQSFEESFLVKPKKNKVKKIFSDSEDESEKENSKFSENSKIHEKDDSELDDSEPETANVESSDESEWQKLKNIS